jgi:ABC-type branched-subunit amino acid transport system substrate-binding protein
MTLFYGTLTRLKRRVRDSGPRLLVTFPIFPRRHWIVSALMVIVLLIGIGYLTWWGPWQKCGPGMTATGSPYVCVGLDLDSMPFRDADPMADLENVIAENNRTISEPFATIVLLEDMAPDPKNDSVALRQTRHEVEGAITAVSRANDPKTAGAIPKIKFLLANFDLEAGAWSQAVDAIKQARLSEHIVAVAGIGQSLDTTRAAVASLSDAGIAVVGSNVTADNMNVAPGPGGKRSTNFFRVAPTNTEEARAAAKYIKQRGYHKVLLVKDTNEGDSYTQTLANALGANVKVDNTEPYRSPSQRLNVATRAQLMAQIFAEMHSDICAIKPDLIYFAGRGTDLGYFLTALSSSGACGFSGPLDVMTGDDVSNLVGGPISTFGDLSFTVFYTALAYTDEWSGVPSGSDYVKNYQDFATAFTKERFKDANLDDGHVMVAHDAVGVAVFATQNDPLATTEPDTVAEFLVGIHCQRSFAGASGPIAFDSNGDPIDKAMPILQLHANGTVTQKDLAWPTGEPLDPNSTC